MRQRATEMGLGEEDDSLSEELLKTIKLPADLIDLRKKLPKSKYSSSGEDGLDCPEAKPPPPTSFTKKLAQADHYLQLARRKKQEF
jgi:hypothetical protein